MKVKYLYIKKHSSLPFKAAKIKFYAIVGISVAEQAAGTTYPSYKYKYVPDLNFIVCVTVKEDIVVAKKVVKLFYSNIWM